MKWLIAALASMTVLVASAIEAPKPPRRRSRRLQQAPAPQEPAKDEPATAAATATPVMRRSRRIRPRPSRKKRHCRRCRPDTVPSGPPPQRFNPTEKVRADFPVSFPIDI